MKNSQKTISCEFTLGELKVINKAMGFAIDELIEFNEPDTDTDDVNEHIAELIADNE